ncbi:MAG: hypothetical protein JSW66_12000 [Phycisphaerales bacterium]|nr:MAG: hypothetical protein JSW66_12000 [Phycisphaerales bacterium]
MRYTKFAVAAAIYAVFAVYLYRHYFKGFGAPRLQDLFVISAPLASLGCYVLSRRWVAGFAGSFFAGSLYGFGPFALGLAKFHPTAGFLAAAVPWMFWPAAFGPKGRWQFLRVPFSVLPFLAIVLFFQLAAHVRLYPIPIQLKLHVADVAGFFAPLVAAKRQMTLLGFYHIPLAALIVGFFVLVAARRFKIMAVFAVPTILAFCDSMFSVSPIVWLAISMLCGSIVAGAGMQALMCAGPADRKWILSASVVMGILAIATLLSATKCFQVFAGLGSGYAVLLIHTAKVYILGAIATAILYFLVRAKLRIHPVRLLVLCAPMTLDIFFSARFVIDRILFL